MKYSKAIWSACAGMFLLLSSCSLAPKYARPEAPVPTEWPAGSAYVEPAADAPIAPELAWQEFFVDERLQALLGLALENNRDLRLAALNVERARALYGIKQRELFPVVEATGRGSKTRAAADLTAMGQPRVADQYSVNLGVLSWEMDFFGRLRSLKDRALEEFLATEQARRSAEILLMSSVANAYLALAADRENLALAEATLQSQQAAHDLVRRRLDAGVANELDVRRAQTPVDTARRDIAGYMQLVAQDENALSFLVGSPVPSHLLPVDLGSVAPPKAISAGLNSEVLLRRPDVLQAEDMLKAAHADIGAARAAFFPRISLTTALGTASDDLSGLFQPGNGTWSYAPQVVMPIFDARTWSALKASKVQREIAVTQYERAIQNAFREVADAMAVRGTVGQQMLAQESLVHGLAETHRLSVSRYEKGVDSYLGVLDAQRSLFAAQQGLVALRYTELVSQVDMYAVLGGSTESTGEMGAGGG